MTPPDHDVGRADDPGPRDELGVPEPLPPGCIGSLFALAAAVGLGVVFSLWMDSIRHTGSFLSALGSGIGGAAIVGLGIVVVPIASLVAFFVGRGYGHRRRVNLLLSRLTADDRRDGE